AVAHVQVYLGPPTAWGRTQFLAQAAMAFTGLERQRTDDRIRTLAHYAGIPDGELQLDVGVDYVQKASLAGLSPLAAMRSAVETERGGLFVNGGGQLIFHNRQRTYNI